MSIFLNTLLLLHGINGAWFFWVIFCGILYCHCLRDLPWETSVAQEQRDLA